MFLSSFWEILWIIRWIEIIDKLIRIKNQGFIEIKGIIKKSEIWVRWKIYWFVYEIK